MIVSIILVVLTILTTMVGLNYFSAHQSKWINSFIYGGGGGVIGGINYSFINGSSGILSLIEYSITGDFGTLGYAFAGSIFILVSVWGYNFFRHDGVVIR